MELIVKFLADGLFVVLLVGAGLTLLLGTSWRTKLTYYPYVIMAGLTSLLIGKLLSIVYQPTNERPFIQQGLEAGAAYIDNPGFPSDHVLLATIVALTTIVFLKNRWLRVAMAVAVLAIGVGRVLALVHTPMDIVGGIIAGLSGGVWYWYLTKNK